VCAGCMQWIITITLTTYMYVYVGVSDPRMDLIQDLGSCIRLQKDRVLIQIAKNSYRDVLHIAPKLQPALVQEPKLII
jgi:hypothetical protein